MPLFSVLSRNVWWGKSWLWLGNSWDRLVQKQPLHCLCCLLRVVVLLEGEPSLQSTFASRLSACSDHLSLGLKTAPYYYVSTHTIPYGDGQLKRDTWFPPDTMFCIQTWQSWSENPFSAFWQISVVLPCKFYWVVILFGHCTIKAWRLSCAEICRRFSHLHSGTLELCQSEAGSWSWWFQTSVRMEAIVFFWPISVIYFSLWDHIYIVDAESIQTPTPFPHFVTLKPYSKMDKIFFSSHQSKHNTPEWQNESRFVQIH